VNELLPSQNMDDVNDLLLYTVENTARRYYQLATRQTYQFVGVGAHEREFRKPFDGCQYTLDEFASRRSILQGNIICNRIQFLNRGISPDYSSHRSSRRFACA